LKKIAAIGLLFLLLYNMFGLTTAILLFDDQYKLPSAAGQGDEYQLLKVYVPSLPYTSDWENTDGLEGLTESQGKFYNTTHVLHSNDTLYVTLKSNQPARDRFFELANRMQSLTDSRDQAPDSAQGKALKLLDNLLKNYVQNDHRFVILPQDYKAAKEAVAFAAKKTKHHFFLLKLPTPPPENC
jgi:hypothetical protein